MKCECKLSNFPVFKKNEINMINKPYDDKYFITNKNISHGLSHLL